MNHELMITGVGTVLTIAGSNIALIGWLRADMKLFEAKIDSWKSDIDKESKDFHGRLCEIEANKKRK